MDADNYYKIDIKKKPTDEWRTFYSDKYIVYTEGAAKARIAVLKQGVVDYNDPKKMSYNCNRPGWVPLEWEWRARGLNKEERCQLQRSHDRMDKKVTTTEWEPFGIVEGE